MSELDQLVKLQKGNKALKAELKIKDRALEMMSERMQSLDADDECPNNLPTHIAFALPNCQDACPDNKAECWAAWYIRRAQEETRE